MLTDKEKEILIITAEECGEVVQAVSKLLRFGKENVAAYSNVDRLNQEVGDLLCMVDLLIEFGIINQEAAWKSAKDKRLRLENYSSIFE